MQRLMMWANYRRGPSLSVPAPSDGDATVPWWYDKIASMASSLAHHGITDILFPQPVKTNAGAFPGADGYGPYDDYDIGSKNTGQFGGIPTRFGTADLLRRAIAICHANGMNVLTDHVMHQRMGGHNGVYTYDSATQKGEGRFPKTPSCFVGAPPRVPRDPIPDVPDDFSFGDELCPVNAVPAQYVWDGLIDAGDWLFRTLGTQGARLDDMKGMNQGFIKAFITAKAMNGKWFFGEYASGNRNDTVWWVNQVDGEASASDFDFHYNMAEAMCNNLSGFNMGSLAGRGMIGVWPQRSVPFVESMDSDTDGFGSVKFNKILGYALLLTGEGLPQVYIRDYLREMDCYGLEIPINNLMWCANVLANGNTLVRYRDPHVYVYERDGNPGCIVALNGDAFNDVWHTVTVQTHFGGNVRLHDFTGRNAQDCWTDASGHATFGIPPGANGTGYGVWSRAEFQGRAINRQMAWPTVQDFDGADDLDIPPLTAATTEVCRIWCEANTIIHHKVLGAEQREADFLSTVVITGPDGGLIQDDTTDVPGWHTVTIQGDPTNATARIAFTLRLTYVATKTLALGGS